MLRTLICILLFASQLEAKYPLSICTIFKDDAPFLKEWIEFHKLQGVEHFYLYNNNSSDEYEEVLAPYVQQGEVTLIDWLYTYKSGKANEWLKIQHAAYMDCIKKYGAETKWLAVIDSDEFLFCPSGEALTSFLESYEDYGGVCANWLMFGTSNIENIPEGYLMIELLTSCSLPNYERNIRVKSIVQPKHVYKVKNSHSFYYKKGYFAVNANLKPVRDMSASEIIHDKIRINHYWTRTEEYFLEKKCISRNARRNFENEANLRKRANLYNLSSNTDILQFVPSLREAMGIEPLS